MRGDMVTPGSRVFFLIVCCLIVRLGANHARGQTLTPDVRYKHLSLEHGLSQSSPNAILRDSYGYMWFGTQDGLNCYDGYEFTVFKHSERDSFSLADNYVTTIIEDFRGDLWIGTYSGGISIRERATGRFKRIVRGPWGARGINVQPVMKIVEDHSHNIWVAVWSNCVSRFDPFRQTWTDFTPNPADSGSLVHAMARDFVVDRAGRVWVCTFGGLDRFDSLSQKFIHYHATIEGVAGLPDDRVISAFEDGDGDLWFGTLQNGAALYSWEQQAFVKKLAAGSGPWGLNSNHVNCIDQGNDGTIWIGSWDAGVTRLDKRSGQVWRDRSVENVPGCLSGDQIVCIYSDNTGGMWLGVDGAGIDHYDPHRFKFRQIWHIRGEGQSLSSPSVRSLFESRAGVLWIGLMGGLDAYDLRTGNFTHYRNEPTRRSSLSGNLVMRILEDRNGRIWVATYGGGLSMFDTNTRNFRVFRADPGNPIALGNDYIMTLLETRDGSLWIGTYGGGLNRMDPRTFKCERFTPSQKGRDMGGNFIYAIHEEPSGELWLGTWGAGITVIDPKSLRVRVLRHDPAVSTSLSNNTVHDIYRDRGGSLWIATMGGGLDCYDFASGGFRHLTEEDGLPNNTVYGVLEDSTGQIWLSTNSGICCYDPLARRFRNYGLSDGLQSLEFNQGAFCKGSGGRLYFGGINGLNIVEPYRLLQSKDKPLVVVAQIKVMDREISIPATPQRALDLAPDQNFLSFMFSVLDYTAPEQNTYRYMLEGLDRTWINAGTRRYAAYTDLQPGEYVLRVRGSNSDGIWNVEGASIEIRVNPPYWRTLWFRALALAGFFGMVFGFYRDRIRRLKKEQAAQTEFSRKLNESQENERKRIAGELHDSLGQDLLTIKNRLGRCSDISEPELMQREIQEVSGFVQLTIEEVREISVDLHPHMLERLGLTRTIESTVKKCSSSTGMSIHATVDNIDGIFSPTQEINAFRIVQEGLNNVVKHSKASECTIVIQKSESTCGLTIQDDGCGFSPAQTTGVSDPNRGFGLLHMAERVRLLHGSMDIVSSPGNGTTLHITFPIPQRGSSKKP
jgi:signal transduction histidine kinase/streptogramin lyase